MAWMLLRLARMSESAEPRWVRNALLAWWTEIRSLLVTMWTFVSSPRRFGSEWADGKLDAMNPLGVVLASATVLLPADYGLQQLLGWDHRANVGFWIEIGRASRPYLFSALTGVVIHAAMRLVGSQRRLSTTIGLLLYATVLSWLFWCLGLVVCYLTGAGDMIPNLGSLISLGWAAAALAGAQRVRLWWCAPVVLGASAFAIPVLINLLLGRAGLT